MITGVGALDVLDEIACPLENDERIPNISHGGAGREQSKALKFTRDCFNFIKIETKLRPRNLVPYVIGPTLPVLFIKRLIRAGNVSTDGLSKHDDIPLTQLRRDPHHFLRIVGVIFRPDFRGMH